MKIRTGFVSNSSSSSFIVAYNYENNNAIIDLLEFIEWLSDKTSEDDATLIAHGKKEVQSKIEEMKEWLDEEKYKNIKKEFSKIPDHWTFINFSIDRNNPFINDIIQDNNCRIIFAESD